MAGKGDPEEVVSGRRGRRGPECAMHETRAGAGPAGSVIGQLVQ